MELAKEIVLDKNGRPKGVILKISEYKKLLHLIEELEDSLDLKYSVETAHEFITHKELIEKLRKDGTI